MTQPANIHLKTGIRNPRLQAVTLAFSLLGLGYISWRHFFPPSVTKAAEENGKRVFAGDVAYLYDQSPEWEKEQLHLSPSQLEEIRTRVVLPKIQGWTYASQTSINYYSMNGAAVSEFKVTNPNNAAITWAENAELTDEGPRYDFGGLFNQLWFFDYVNKHHVTANGTARLLGALEGIKTDAATLTRCGMAGLPAGDGKHNIVPWSRIAANCTRMLQGGKL